MMPAVIVLPVPDGPENNSFSPLPSAGRVSNLSFAKTPSALKSLTFLSQAGSLSAHDGNPPLSDSLFQILV
jgi:hypothetical protein